MQPIGDPEDHTGDSGDFAEEHETTEVDEKADGDDKGETESPGRFTGGLDSDGLP